MKNYLSILFLVAIFGFLFFYFSKFEKPVANNLPIEKSEKESTQIEFVAIGNQKIKVEVVSTPEARTLGLSGRASLGEQEGMLFVFDVPDKYSFWMKDMNFPIDIIWIDENFRIIYIKENAEPKSYPNAFGPNQDSKYVLEVVAGFTGKYNIKEGDNVTFTP